MKNREKTTTIQPIYAFRKGYWLHFFLGVLAIYSIYALIISTYEYGHLRISATWEIFLMPEGASLAIAIFSLLFFFSTIRGYSRLLIPKIAAYILVSVALLATAATLFFGGNALVFYVFFQNPYTSLLFSATAVIGSIALLIELARHRKSS